MMPKSIRFRHIDTEKTIEAIALIARERPGLTFFYICKIFYWAEKDHLNRYGRPILGDRYIAMEHGPVPSLVYNLLKQDQGTDAELMSSFNEKVEIRQGQRSYVHLREGAQVNEKVLSRTDIECLRASIDRYADLQITQLRQMTHEEEAYEEAGLNSEIDYEKMIAKDTPDRDKLIQSLREMSRHMVF